MRLNKEYYKLREVESILGVTQRTLYRYIESGKLQATKPAGQWVVSREALQLFFKGGK